jgi:predicted dehydrogenase
MKKLRLGVIGAWGRGRLSYTSHRPDENVELVAGMDVSQESLDCFKKRMKEEYNNEPATYTDYKEMLDKEDLDGVFVTSPDFCHEEQAYEALSRGIGVYLEKPMTITIEGCDKLLKVAHEKKAKIFLGHNMRYMAFTNKMKEIIDAGTIGEVQAIWCRHFVSYGGDAYFRDWHSEQKYATSMLLQKGAHDIDIIHWLAGSFTDKVVGMGKLSVYNRCERRKPDEKGDPSFQTSQWPPLEQKGFSPNIDVEDHSMIMMQLRNGIQACYLQCHYTPEPWRNYTIIGTNGRIENYGDGEEGSSVQVWTKRSGRMRLIGDQSYGMMPTAGGHGGSDTIIITSFINYLRGQEIPTSTPQAARYSVATGCKGAESMRTSGNTLEIPRLPDDIENYIF